MATGLGHILEIRSGGGGAGLRSAYIACSPELAPSPGEYLLGTPVRQPGWGGSQDSTLAAALFLAPTPAGPSLDLPGGFWAGPPVPKSWPPGTRLHLRGPCGRGFHLPPAARHIALADAGGGSGPLLALAGQALQKNRSVVYFGGGENLAQLPAAVEAYPLDSLGEARDWADYLAVDVTLDDLPDLAAILGLGEKTPPGLPIEVLVRAPMPCGGLAKCGVCAFQRGKEWLLACEDGPVIRY